MKYLVSLALIAAIGLTACHQGAGKSTAGATPVATVNGTPISRDLFDYYLKNISGNDASTLTADQRSQALDALIRAEVVAQHASQQGLLKQKDNAALLQLTRLNVVQQIVSSNYLKDKQPTEQELRAEYETQVATMPKVEYHARHILVATKAFAEELIKKLEAGKDFADLARRESMDSSKDKGGDLGWFTANHMVKPFAEAVAALKPGQFTHQPVKTKYGWHIIELLGTRPVKVPDFDSVKQRLVQIVQSRKFKQYEDGLEKKAKITKAKKI